MLLAVWLIGSSTSCNGQSETKVLISTNMGQIKVMLYNETPLHRDNFVKLVKEGFYDSTLFHRVIKDFMIQAGDPDSRGAQPGKMLGGGGPGYNVAAEFVPHLFHRKGALSAARMGDQVNPKKESSGSQFYIVQGKPATEAELDQIEAQLNHKRNSAGIRQCLEEPEQAALRAEVMLFQQNRNGHALDSIANMILDSLRAKGTLAPTFRFSEQQRKVYTTEGGTPFLDSEYTVFGQVLEGLEVLDIIAAVPTAAGDRPQSDVVILKMEIVK